MIELSGLSATNPQAVLASFGLLRLVSQAYPAATLAWGQHGAPAILEGGSWDALLEVLRAALDEREKAPELNWADSIKSYPRERYREQMATLPAEQLAWLEAFWAETTNWKGEVLLRVTRWNMTGSTQMLFASVRKLAPAIRKRFEAAIEEALLGPWLNADKLASLGWDPGARKTAAAVVGGKSPSSAADISVAGAMWLAFEGLPLFPARWMAGGRDEVVWALPHRPVTFGGLRQMQLAAPWMPAAERAAQGWTLWRSGIESNGRLKVLLPAVQVF